MSNIIQFPVQKTAPVDTGANIARNAVEKSRSIPYAALPAHIIANPALNFIATQLQKNGWKIDIRPGSVVCTHPSVESAHPIGFVEAFEIQKILDGRLT